MTVIAYSVALGGFSFTQASTSYQLPNEPVPSASTPAVISPFM